MKKSKIKLFVKPNSKVEHKNVIYGKANVMVQAWVLANDGLYYLQPPAVRQGNKFSIECTFGFEEPSDALLGYEAFVVASCERPHSPQPALPDGDFVSVRVYREP